MTDRNIPSNEELDESDCALCEGKGEIDGTDLEKVGSVGCPECIGKEATELRRECADKALEIERLQRELAEARELIAHAIGGQHETRESKLETALRGLYWDQVDYLTLNKLGGMQNHWMRAARDALGMDVDDVRPTQETGEIDPNSKEALSLDLEKVQTELDEALAALAEARTHHDILHPTCNAEVAHALKAAAPTVVIDTWDGKP